MMQAEEYLDQIKKLDSMIKNRIKDHAHWVEIAEGYGGAALGERVQTSRNLHRGSDAIDKYIDIEQEIERLKEERLSIIRTIEKLPSSEYEVIYKLYVQDYSIKEIAYQKKKSYRWVRYKKENGLKLLQEILDRA
jgi:DNA-directed RNA polymerase specialized sigma24 family protein